MPPPSAPAEIHEQLAIAIGSSPAFARLAARRPAIPRGGSRFDLYVQCLPNAAKLDLAQFLRPGFLDQAARHPDLRRLMLAAYGEPDISSAGSPSREPGEFRIEPEGGMEAHPQWRLDAFCFESERLMLLCEIRWLPSRPDSHELGFSMALKPGSALRMPALRDGVCAFPIADPAAKEAQLFFEDFAFGLGRACPALLPPILRGCPRLFAAAEAIELSLPDGPRPLPPARAASRL